MVVDPILVVKDLHGSGVGGGGCFASRFTPHDLTVSVLSHKVNDVPRRTRSSLLEESAVTRLATCPLLRRIAPPSLTQSHKDGDVTRYLPPGSDERSGPEVDRSG
ncbi:hypothetical protein E2C01_058277 [Portunus trituberculatus]|uniref:Uncharacterized protein n=1 Tax=Portunus trituberculatus TaxID=210409 RepID=A0A5B7H2R6_PORTR|nr:hypothetical protein [Portunus trituberculatus]